MLAGNPASGKRDSVRPRRFEPAARLSGGRRPAAACPRRERARLVASVVPEAALSWPESGQPRPSCDACDASSWRPGKPRQPVQRPQAQQPQAEQPREQAQRLAAPRAQGRQPEGPARRPEVRTRLRTPPQSVVTRSVSYFSRSPFCDGAGRHDRPRVIPIACQRRARRERPPCVVFESPACRKLHSGNAIGLAGTRFGAGHVLRDGAHTAKINAAIGLPAPARRESGSGFKMEIPAEVWYGSNPEGFGREAGSPLK
jgi:hypothetical protein